MTDENGKTFAIGDKVMCYGEIGEIIGFFAAGHLAEIKTANGKINARDNKDQTSATYDQEFHLQAST